MNKSKLFQVSNSKADAKLALVLAVPSMATSFSINTTHGDLHFNGAQAKTVSEFVEALLLSSVVDAGNVNHFELTLEGFDGGTDATDGRIIAISTAMTEMALREFLSYMAHQVVEVVALPDDYPADDIDFRLPEDVAGFRARIREVLAAKP